MSSPKPSPEFVGIHECSNAYIILLEAYCFCIESEEFIKIIILIIVLISIEILAEIKIKSLYFSK